MLPITKKLTKINFSKGNDIKYIVLHDTGNIKDSDEGNAKYFENEDRGASAHYFVDDDSITQVVEDLNAAWHVGDGKGKFGITNHNSIGIEMCNASNSLISEKTEQNTIELVKSLMKKYNVPIEKVVRHYDASGKNCPADFSSNDWARWKAFKAKLIETPKPKVIYKVQVGAFGEEVNAKAMLDKLKKAGFEGVITKV